MGAKVNLMPTHKAKAPPPEAPLRRSLPKHLQGQGVGRLEWCRCCSSLATSLGRSVFVRQSVRTHRHCTGAERPRHEEHARETAKGDDLRVSPGV